METKKLTQSYKSETTVFLNGRSMPVWIYDHLPSQVKRVSSISELRYGRPFLYESALIPGEYHTEYMRKEIVPSVRWYLENGFGVYVNK